MITNDPKEIELLRQGGRILAEVLQIVAAEIVPGMSADRLNALAENEIRNKKAVASFKNYQAHPQGPKFPASLCVSVDNEVVHGIPRKDKILKEGSIVGLDLGIIYHGFYTDGAISVPVGKVSQQDLKLIQTTKDCLDKALSVVKPGAFTGDIGNIIETVAKQSRFEVVRELVGHGVGLAVHEDPEIPCFGKLGTGTRLEEGMVLAIEPMVNAGKWKVNFAYDKWTIMTVDGSKSAHFEYTILVTKSGCEILTKVV